MSTTEAPAPPTSEPTQQELLAEWNVSHLFTVDVATQDENGEMTPVSITTNISVVVYADSFHNAIHKGIKVLQLDNVELEDYEENKVGVVAAVMQSSPDLVQPYDHLTGGEIPTDIAVEVCAEPKDF